MIVQAFVSSCLEYCNSLLYGISDRLLQSVQNIAVRLVTSARRVVHATPVTLAVSATRSSASSTISLMTD